MGKVPPTKIQQAPPARDQSSASASAVMSFPGFVDLTVPELISKGRACFADADLDGNGSLSKTEVKKYMKQQRELRGLFRISDGWQRFWKMMDDADEAPDDAGLQRSVSIGTDRFFYVGDFVSAIIKVCRAEGIITAEQEAEANQLTEAAINEKIIDEPFNTGARAMRIIVDTAYVWLGATSFEVEPETTLSELCQLFKAKEDQELEQLVFNRVLYPDDMPKITALKDVHLSLEDMGVRHGDTLHAIFDKPLPKLKCTTNDSSRNFESEAKFIALGKLAVEEEKVRNKEFDDRECVRTLPPGWSRAKGDEKTRKPGVWYYRHDDGTVQWKFPKGNPEDEVAETEDKDNNLLTMTGQAPAPNVAEAN